MRPLALALATLVACSQPAWGLYGPSLERTDIPVEIEACTAAHFSDTSQIVSAIKTNNMKVRITAVALALRQWRNTPKQSAL